MKRRQLAFWSLTTISFLLIAITVMPNSAVFLPKSNNPALNKAAVNSETPFIVLGMGCFWGAEKRMQSLLGVLDVEAGYAGGDSVNPSYETLHDSENAISQGKAIKNHAEVVKIYYDPKQTSLEQVLIHFWENHNPTQGNRQGNDIGSNYRSTVFYRSNDELKLAEKTRAIYENNLKKAGINNPISTEIAPLKNYTAAENYHQDYLEKNPLGYCGLGGTGVAYSDPSQPNHSEKRDGVSLANNLPQPAENWQQIKLNSEEQLIAFEAVDCGYCRRFDKEVLANWKNKVNILATNNTNPPRGWRLNQTLFATPTIVLFRNQQEVARYTGYQGAEHFWQWLSQESSKF